MTDPPDNGSIATPADNGPISDEPVATGDRREEVHYEADPDQLVQVSHRRSPSGPLPEEMAETGGHADPPPTPIGDVALTPAGPSAWDARPAPGQAEKSGDPA
jgi:hypothetical protein